MAWRYGKAEPVDAGAGAIRVRDGSGDLIAAGFRWEEYRRPTWVFYAHWIVALILFVAAIVMGVVTARELNLVRTGMLSSAQVGVSSGVGSAAVITIGLALAWLLYARRFVRTGMVSCQVRVFNADGSVTLDDDEAMAHGRDSIPTGAATWRVEDVASIEAEPVPSVAGGQYRHGEGRSSYPVYRVRIYLNDGSVKWAGHHLPEDDARVVQRQLKLAYDAIAENMMPGIEG